MRSVRNLEINLKYPQDMRPKTQSKLVPLAKGFMLKPAYPKDVLVAAVCKTYTIEHKNEWESNSSIPIMYNFKGLNRKHTMYAYPEYSTERKQNEPRLLDPTHLLTNMRVHATTKNMVESQANAFLQVSKFNNDVLDRAIMEDLMDKQSSKIAMKVFSKEVEDAMVLLEAEDEKKEMQKPKSERRQIVRTSKFVKVMRNWCLACDACGYTPRQRVHMMRDLYDLLMKDVDFTQYPPPSTHIKGIPIVMYEGILQNISLHIAMYKYAKNNSYNQKAICTLPVENAFDDLTAMEFSDLGCPKSTDIMRLMAHAIQLNHHRLDPTR